MAKKKQKKKLFLLQNTPVESSCSQSLFDDVTGEQKGGA